MKKLQELLSTMGQGVNLVISPTDEMFLHIRNESPSEEAARTYYFDTGKELATALLQHVLSVGLDPQHLEVLDFATGYGRVSRWLVPAFGTVTVADLDQEMVDFQQREFGVQGFLSSRDPTILSSHEQSYDIIFVFSLFTHLPDATWRA